MQVSIETTSGLERRMTIVVPSETFEQQISERLKATAQRGARRGQDAHAGHDAMPGAGEEVEAASGGRLVLGLRQDAAAARHHGVGREHDGAAAARRHGGRLLLGEALGMLARQLAAVRRLVEDGRVDRVGLDADLAQEVEAPRRGGGQDERQDCGHLAGARPIAACAHGQLT